MVDLHLFLGRPLVEAQKDSEAQDDGLFGSVPQTIIDAEQNFLKTAHDKAHGLVSLLIYHQRRRRRHYIRKLKQPRRWRKRERHLKMSLRVSAIIFQLFKVIMFEKCVLTVLELNWNQRLGHKKTKLNICHHVLTSTTQLQNRSFHVVERTRTSSKCQKKNARAKRAKILFFILKYANLWGFCCRRRRGCLSSLLLSLLSEKILLSRYFFYKFSVCDLEAVGPT